MVLISKYTLHKSQTNDTRPQNTAIIPHFCTISSMGAMQTRWQTCNYVIILRKSEAIANAEYSIDMTSLITNLFVKTIYLQYHFLLL